MKKMMLRIGVLRMEDLHASGELKERIYYVRTAKTLKEDEELLKVGFEYVTERDGVKIYRKRK